jgi:hypothetical protein
MWVEMLLKDGTIATINVLQISYFTANGANETNIFFGTKSITVAQPIAWVKARTSATTST